MGSASSPTSPWFATASLTAPEARSAIGALVGHSPTSQLAAEGGVVPASPDPFALTSVGTSSAPAWSVAVGQIVIQRPIGGTYVGTWSTPQSIAVDLPLPSSGLSRIDLLVADIIDSEADSGETAPTTGLRVKTVAGTPSSSPTAPAVPAGCEPLWQYNVAANGSLTGVLTRRRWTRGVGGIRFVEAGDTRAGSHIGDTRCFATGQVDMWLNPSGTPKWVTIIAPMVWTQEAASLQGAGPAAGEFGLGTGGTKIMRWKRTGNDLTVSYAFRWGTPPHTAPGGNVTTYLPQGWVTPAGRDQWIPCQLWVNDTPNSHVALDFCGMALIQAGSNVVRPYFPRSNGSGGYATGLLPYRVATGAGPGNSIPYIAAGYASGGTLHVGPAIVELAS